MMGPEREKSNVFVPPTVPQIHFHKHYFHRASFITFVCCPVPLPAGSWNLRSAGWTQSEQPAETSWQLLWIISSRNFILREAHTTFFSREKNPITSIIYRSEQTSSAILFTQGNFVWFVTVILPVSNDTSLIRVQPYIMPCWSTQYDPCRPTLSCAAVPRTFKFPPTMSLATKGKYPPWAMGRASRGTRTNVTSQDTKYLDHWSDCFS